MDARVVARILARASDLAVQVDPDGVIRELNAGDDSWRWLVGKRWLDTVTPESLSKAEQLLKEVWGGEPTLARELNQRRQDGMDEVPFKFNAVALDAKRVALLAKDLSPLAALQQQMVVAQQAMDREYGRLRQADTRYRVLFQVASEGVVVADTGSLRIGEVNPAAASLLGDSAASLTGRSVQELFAPRSWPSVLALLAAVEAGGRPGDIEVKLNNRAQEVVISASLFRQSGAPHLLLRVRPTGAEGEGDRVTARHLRFQTVLEALPDGLVVTDPDLKVLSANPAFCDLVQQANENQVLGHPLDRWVGRPGVDLNIMVASLREHGVVRNFSTIIRSDYGTPQEAVVSAVAAMDGKVPSFGFSLRPVSARLSAVPTAGLPLPRSVEQLRGLVGRVSLKEIVREAADLIERLCIEAALEVSGNNRASAAQLLGLSRQGLYSKLRRHGLGDLDPV